ncbi:MAG: ABC transporter ATP-binding protein/permease [candidate division Zixibacteria bacterium]|nr:ABC transporter ATP-binding protein/permease [candidate division Zixibacteria bacterium]
MIIPADKLKRLWGYLRPYWVMESFTLATMGAIALLSLALPIAIQYMIDTLIPGLVQTSGQPVDIQPVVLFVVLLLGLYLSMVLLGWLRDYLVAYVGSNIIRDIRSQLFAHLERLSLRFYQDHQVGEVMSRTLSDVGRVQDLLTSTLLMFFTNILMLIAVVAYLVQTNWMLTVVALIPVPATIILANRYGKKLNLIATGIQQTIASLTARLQESLLSVKTVKAFGQEEREQKRVDGVLGSLTGYYIKSSVTNSLAVNVTHFVNMIGPIIVLGWGVYLVATGGMKLGELIAFYILLNYLYAPIHSLAETNLQVSSAMASVDRVFEYLDLPEGVTEAATPVTLGAPRGEIQMEHVSFDYGNGGFQIRDLALHIRAKEKIALVGPSGSGKTTIINLIMRFFDPDKGEILLDGIDLRSLSIASLRNGIALVDQDPVLFKMSIFDNIAYGHPAASEAQVMDAARVANIHDFIMSLPNGYKTEVGERGVTVSGGERQRICLARAIIKDPAVLILDEATSALDSQSEQLIQDALRKVLVDKTAIIIAHRLSTVQHVDRIVALENGKIIDQGKHDELTERCPLYRELAAKQMLI